MSYIGVICKNSLFYIFTQLFSKYISPSPLSSLPQVCIMQVLFYSFPKECRSLFPLLLKYASSFYSLPQVCKSFLFFISSMQVLFILYLKYASPFWFFSQSMQVPFPLQQRVCTSNYLFYLTLPTLLSATLFTVQYLITITASVPTHICCLVYSAVPNNCWPFFSTYEYLLPSLQCSTYNM